MASLMQEKNLNNQCPTCHNYSLQVPNDGKEWYLQCSECQTILLCYEPLPHQQQFHQDPSKIKAFFGGYGSGKTTTTVMEMVRHQLETPGGTSLMGAATYPQLEQTSMKEWFEIMPTSYIKHHNKSKNYVDLINGHRILFRSLDDEGKARSLNLSAFHIEEASEVPFEYYVQLLTRLRNRATTHHMAVLSSNPDISWIKTDILLKANKIYNSDENYSRSDIDPNISVHIAPTRLNTYLPPTFYEDTARGRPEWWVERYLNGSFQNREGLVYSMAQDHYVEPFQIPKHWERLMALDPGLVDPTAVVWGAIDPKTGTVYLYDEHYKREKPVSYHAEKINEKNKEIPAGLLWPPVGDPSGQARNKSDQRSTFDHYAEYGVYLKPGINKIEDGIMKVFTYFALGKVKIFDSLKYFKWEIEQYKYPERKMDDDKSSEKPVDKNNHLMDAFRYLINELPDDPSSLINKSYGTNNLIYGNMNKEKHLPFALQDEDPYEQQPSDWVSYY